MNVRAERVLPPLRPIIIVGTLLLLLVVAGGFTRNAAQPAPTTRPPSYSDAQIKSIMEGNIAQWSGQGWYPAIHLNGSTPDIAVTDGVLIVATLLPPEDVATATSICRAIAASTHDPDTAASLGVAGVVIIAGGQKIVDCRP